MCLWVVFTHWMVVVLRRKPYWPPSLPAFTRRPLTAALLPLLWSGAASNTASHTAQHTAVESRTGPHPPIVRCGLLLIWRFHLGREMACNEDCDQILLAGNKTSDEGWRENGESLEIWGKSLYSLFLDRFVSRRRWRRIAGGLGRGGDLGQQRCGQVNPLIFISSFSLQLETVGCWPLYACIESLLCGSNDK